jgi:transposase InsO family protein
MEFQKSIVSDRDRVFTSSFWTELFKLLQTELKISSAYHPQTDEQIERINQCLKMYLRCAVQATPKQWFKWLPLAKLWYNTLFHTSLQCSSFKALYGTEPFPGLIPSLRAGRLS